MPWLISMRIGSTDCKKLWPALIACSLAVLLSTDPLRLSPIAQFPEFEAHYVELPLQSQLQGFPRDSDSKLQAAELKFVGEVHGPESIAFDALGRGPYTGLSDGRILRWDGATKGWTEFAFTSPNWTEACKGERDGLGREHICGRPLGLRFNKTSGELFIADAYFGLLVVGPDGGQATTLSTEAEGIPFKFTNDLDLDDEGNVFFTDTSSKYPRRSFFISVLAGENSGRLLKYNRVTNHTSVLLHGLKFPNGVSVNRDGSFLIVAEGTTARLLRYWLKGPKSKAAETFALLPGYPDNVRMNEQGDFWVALHCRFSSRMLFFNTRPNLRKFLLNLPIPMRYIYSFFLGQPQGIALKINASSGQLLELLEDQTGKVVKMVSEVQEREGRLWMGSALLPQIAIY
ncbi:hypothetical protein O6H91_08G070900 [Diphasiastrum complanatum]|uniref:Uncharacterized protein n=1 Tax=Diphasiastrum complanatum TaxID=34168 RepID=A0ACC2CZ06_DIPCM|nr:hypothetical protein O6H91_Y345300 [Diphasiastrum complanatum]KAJ7547133.1 hypothetical protein O6H91_08G070900 [Diphasiastrum complanatum]